MKNYLHQSVLITITVGLLLTLLSFLPEGLEVGGFPLRKMDIFADIRAEHSLPVDTLELVPPVDSLLADTLSVSTDSVQILGPLPPVDASLFGQIIEDYSPDQVGLDSFFAAIDLIPQGHSVRVAFFGDSFIEGDILIGDLRDSLQSLFGGNGVGFVPITSEVAKFKRTLVHDYKGWGIHSIIKKEDMHPAFGINGFVYTPGEGAQVRYQGTGQYFGHTQSWSRTRLFYQADSLSSLVYQINGAPSELRALAASKGKVSTLDLKAAYTHSVDLRFPEPKGLRLYGASLEDGAGIYLDNFSVRGNSGGRLKQIQESTMRAFDDYQHYDLIVVQYGLNAAGNSLRNINWYRQELDQTYAYIKSCFPGRPILVIGVPDRDGKVDGELQTLESVPAIVDMQRELARKHGLLFFDLYRSMGGPGTMVAFSNQKPMLANKDYTHLTHEGGRVVSYLFIQKIMDDRNKYLGKKAEAARQQRG